MTRLIAICFAMCVATSAYADDDPTGGPTTETAKARLEAGTKAFDANDFATASKEFAAGYAAEPWAGFLFAWAQSERQRGDCASAVKLYERFNATNPPAEVRQLSDDAIAACGNKPIEKPIERPEPQFHHKLAIGLGAGAAVVGGVAIYFFVSSGNAADAADRAPTHPEAIDLYDRAQSRRLVAQITGGVSFALATAAVLRFVLHGDGDDRRTIAITPTGATFITRW